MTAFRSMLPILLLMIVAGVIVQTLMKGQIGTLLIIVAVLSAVMMAVLLLYAAEKLPGGMMLRLDKLLGREDRIKNTKKSKLAEFSETRARQVLEYNIVGHDAVALQILDRAILRSADNGRNGPLASALIMTLPGQGASTIARALAAGMYGSEQDVMTVDLRDVGDPSAIFGSADSPLKQYLLKDNELVVVFDGAEAVFGKTAGRQELNILKALLHNADVGDHRLLLRNAIILFISTAAGADAGENANDLGQLRAVAERVGIKPIADSVDLVFGLEKLAGRKLASVVAKETIKIAAGFKVEIARISPGALLSLVGIWSERAQADGAAVAERELRRSLTDELAEARHQGLRNVEIEIVEGELKAKATTTTDEKTKETELL